jgi:hypothetical protein
MTLGVEAILTNLLSQGIWEVGSTSLTSLDAVATAKPLEKAFAAAAEEIEAKAPAGQAADSISVLRAPEARVIVRTLFLQRLTDAGTTPSQAREAFHALCARHGASPVSPDELFDLLVRSCETILDVAIGNGILSAFEAKAAVRHKLLSEQLTALTALMEPHSVTASDIDSFERQLAEEVAERTAYVTPPGH